MRKDEKPAMVSHEIPMSRNQAVLNEYSCVTVSTGSLTSRPIPTFTKLNCYHVTYLCLDSSLLGAVRFSRNPIAACSFVYERDCVERERERERALLEFEAK
ncbi:hypothetical protein Bca4012_061802 [Brassica carinata]